MKVRVRENGDIVHPYSRDNGKNEIEQALLEIEREKEEKEEESWRLIVENAA